MKDAIVPYNSAPAVWCMEIFRPSHTKRSPFKKRLVVTDNFYTLQILAKNLFTSKDGETNMLGTVRMNKVDGIYRSYLKQAIENVKKSTRSSRLMCQAYEKARTDDGVVHIAVRSGYIVFKDRNVCTFYMNDLPDTPKQSISEPNEHATQCVHRLGTLRRWTKIETCI